MSFSANFPSLCKVVARMPRSRSASGPTKFTLIALDLPAETWKKDRQTD